MGGAFLYKDETLWGLGATVIHLYGKPLQKLFCLSHSPSPPGSQARGCPGSEPLQGTPVYCLPEAIVKDRPGWELKLPGRESPYVRRTPQWAHGGRTQGYSCISGKGHWQGTWEGTHSIEEEDRGNLGSGTLFPSPGHIPLRGPQRPSRKGPWALWMDSGLVLWLQEPTPNRSCAQV